MDIGSGFSRDEEEHHLDRLTIPPHRTNTGNGISSPETPHGRLLSESRQLLPKSSKSLFQYTNTTVLDFGDGSGEEQLEFPEWNYEPGNLERGKSQRWWDRLADLLVVCLSLPFFTLAATIVWFDNKEPQANKEESLKQSICIAATLFPLVFSLVIGRLLVKLASYYLERGTTLGLLESLMGSQSFFGNLITQFSLWPLNAISICLIIVWLLSPFGSQAILRSLVVEIQTTTSPDNVTYFNTRQSVLTNGSAIWSPGLATLFSSSLIAPVSNKNGPKDLWGNPKIPLHASLLNTSTPDSKGWHTIPQSTTHNDTIRYSSLTGIPTSFLPMRNTSINTTFTLDNSHLTLTCHNMTTNITRNISEPSGQSSGFSLDIFINPSLISPTGPFISSQNITASTPWAIGYLGHDITTSQPPGSNYKFSLDALPTDSKDIFPGMLLYQDFSGLLNVTSIYCNPQQSYVESEIICSGVDNGCAVSRQRLSLLPHAAETLTALSFAPVLRALTGLLPLLTPQSPTQASDRGHEIDIFQNYLASPDDNAFIQSALWPAESRQESRYLDINVHDFGDRLAGILNMALLATMPDYTNMILGAEIQEREQKNASQAIMDLDQYITVPGTTTKQRKVFSYRSPWLAILILATSAMFLASLAAALLRHLTLAPTYLGFVSSLCRESTAVGMPSGGVGLGGLDKSRRLRELRVRLGDVGEVREGWEIGVGAQLRVGKVGVGRVRGKGMADVVGGLSRGRLYV